VEEGAVRAIRGIQDHPDTAGFICSKVSRFNRRLEHVDRLHVPLRRAGARGSREFEEISWADAIAEIVERFSTLRDEFGAESILPFHYGGSNGPVTDELIDHAFFARLGSSRLDKTICAVPATKVAVAMYGKMPGVAFADYPKASSIVIWGANPKASNIHLAPYLKEAKKNGAFIATVDPRRNFSNSEIDLHLPILPGTDVVLALSLIARWESRGLLAEEFLAEHTHGAQELLERARPWTVDRAASVTGLPVADIETLADTMAERRPSLVRCGWGLERSRFGAQGIAAVLSLPAMLGSFGVPGGGYTMSNNGKANLDRDAMLGDSTAEALANWSTRELNMTQLGKLLTEPLDPPVKALFVYNANPLATVPNQRLLFEGLKRDDLYVVTHDQVMTDTAAWSDLVLPAPTFLEGHDLKIGYGSYVVGGIKPVIDPMGDSRTNMQLFAELGRAFGFDDECFTWEDAEIVRRAAGCISLPDEEVDVDRVTSGGQQPYSFNGGRPIQFDSIHPMTVDGKVDLFPEVLGERAYEWRAEDAPGASAEWPLQLVTPASRHLINSTFGEHAIDRLTVGMNPADAASRGLETGASVRVFNDLGEVHCQTEIDPRVRPGVVSMPKGAWIRASENGTCPTALCPDHVQEVGGAACFNDARVEVAARA